MTTTSLDKIVKNILLKRRYSIHWYMELIINAKDCLRELSFDGEIEATRYVCLPLNNNHAIEIPNDYVDWFEVGVRTGQYIRPLVEDNSLDLVPNYDSEFEIQPYSQGIASSNNLYQQYFPNSFGYWYMVNWNSYGENLGRLFGGVGAMSDTFRVNKARNEIKINENLCVDEVVLGYISNGLDADSATHIEAYAQECIESFCMWKFKENNRTYSAGEAEVAKQEYITQRQILRARKSDLTIDLLRRISQRNAIAIKQ